MAQRNKAAFAGLYGSSGTLFADNSTRQISEADLRALGEDIKDSALYIEDLYKTYGVTASGTDTYTATPNPAITAYAADTVFIIKFTNANTGAATLNLAGLGAKAIVKNAATALSAGDINAGQILALVYDGTNFQIVGGGGGGGGAVSSVNGETGDVVVKQSRVAVVQVSHGFSVGDVLTRISSTTQTIDDTTTQTPIGMVVQVVDADNYILASDGYVSGLSGLTSGTLYYVQNDGSLGTTRTPLPYFLANSSSTGWIIKPNVLSHLQYNRVITTDAQSILQSDNGGKIYFNSASAIDFNIEQLDLNTEVVLINIGAGVVTFVNGTSVTYTGASSLADGSTTPTSAVIIYRTTTSPMILTGSGGSGGGTWGSITGTLSDQTDLSTALRNARNFGLVNINGIKL